MTTRSIDVAVVGGGMVGAAAALGLAKHGFSVAVIEHIAPPAFEPSAPPDIRISAISSASVALLKDLGVCDDVMAMRCHPYSRLETWERENARVVFDADELKLSKLGYMVENVVLQRALWERLGAQPDAIVCCPAHLNALERRACGNALHVDNGDVWDAKLVIGADGANSRVRQWAGIGSHVWQYAQSCMLITVKCENAPGRSTWQHFTPAGPRAFLPLFDRWASLVWYDSPARARQLQAMSMAQLKREIECEFPARLGEVTPFASATFPLIRRHAMNYVQQGLALLGDAAHTIHPLAGQGVNLGYRDVEALLDVLISARNVGESWNSLAVLKRYSCRRFADNVLMQSAMDLFHAGFSNELVPVRILRNLGLMAAARAGSLKHKALKYALGL